ncbi:MAG TPA: uracil-DNA glycosylase, partial [Micavibrio sp.]
LACIGLDRAQEDPFKSIYISNILNWRPPGNRTPTDSEIAVSLPFIERHIQLAGPKLLILAGGVSAKALLGSGDSISKLRGRFQSYLPRTPELREGASPIPVLATYHPAYLLRTPGQKRLVWADMLMLLEKRRELGII